MELPSHGSAAHYVSIAVGFFEVIVEVSHHLDSYVQGGRCIYCLLLFVWSVCLCFVLIIAHVLFVPFVTFLFIYLTFQELLLYSRARSACEAVLLTAMSLFTLHIYCN